MDDVRPEWTMVGRGLSYLSENFWQFDAHVLMPCVPACLLARDCKN